MKELLGLIAVVLTFISLAPYIIDIFNNKTKPHIFTWIVWSIATALAFLGQWQKGAGPGSWTTGITGLLTIFIMIISFKKGSKDITKLDFVMFTSALFGIIPWLLTKDPTLSVMIMAAIDAIAFVPTIRKTMKTPRSETLSTYVINVFRHSLSIVALNKYNLATYIFPTTLAVMNLITTLVIIKFRKNK